MDCVTRRLDSLAAGKDIHAIKINGVDLGAIICKEGCEWPTDYLGAVDNGDGFAKEPISIRKDRVVNLKIFKDLNYREWRAGENRLQGVLLVKEADVLVHVEKIFVAEAFHVLLCADKVLDVSILTRCSRENWVVNNDTMDRLVGISIDYFLFDIFLLDSLEAELEATGEESAPESCNISRALEGRKSRVVAFRRVLTTIWEDTIDPSGNIYLPVCLQKPSDINP